MTTSVLLPKICAWCGTQEGTLRKKVRDVVGGSVNSITWGIVDLPICPTCHQKETKKERLQIVLAVIGALTGLALSIMLGASNNASLGIIGCGLGYYVTYAFISPKLFPTFLPLRWYSDKLWFKNERFHHEFRVLNPDKATDPEKVRSDAQASLDDLNNRKKIVEMERVELEKLLDQGVISKKEYDARLIEIYKKVVNIKS